MSACLLGLEWAEPRAQLAVCSHYATTEMGISLIHGSIRDRSDAGSGQVGNLSMVFRSGAEYLRLGGVMRLARADAVSAREDRVGM